VLDTARGEDAIALAKNNQIDILVTDVQLAGVLSGWDVAEAVRAISPKVTVIYASGNAPDRDRLVEGALYFGKPFDPARVVDTSKQLCGLPAEPQSKQE
jgi:DNA-binding response OmpR family regulator